MRRLAKTRLGRTAPAQLALPASRYCTELRPSQGRTLGQNKLTKCRGGTNSTMPRISKSPVNSRNYSLPDLRSLAKEERVGADGGGWSVQPHLVGVQQQQSHRTAAGCTSPPPAAASPPRQFRANCRGESKLQSCRAKTRPAPKPPQAGVPRRQNLHSLLPSKSLQRAKTETERDFSQRGGGGSFGSFLRFFSGFGDSVTFVKEGHTAHIKNCTIVNW